MRVTALLLLALAGAAAATEAGSLHTLGRDKGRPVCHDLKHRKRTLKLIKETAFSGVFRYLANGTEFTKVTKFEASGVARVQGEFYVVFDNSMALGHLDDRFRFRDPHNLLIGPWEPESQFEGIAYVPENDTFLLLHEAIPHKKTERTGTYKPFIREVRLKKDYSDYEEVANCEFDIHFVDSNKGFESIQYIHTKDGPWLLGMCEGNHCEGGETGKDQGNGRILAAQLKWLDDGSCVWEPSKTIAVPEGAYFTDYSAMAYNYETQKMAILSQEDSAIWIGDFIGDELRFASEEGQLFHLPRDNHCEMIYCNAEGIVWVDNYRIAIASDKAKARQPYWCDAKDQSIHLFAMPMNWDPYSPAAKVNAQLEREVAEELEGAAGGGGAAEL